MMLQVALIFHQDVSWLTNKDTCSFVDVTPVADDAFSYKLALQHNLSDDVMVYGSYHNSYKGCWC